MAPCFVLLMMRFIVLIPLSLLLVIAGCDQVDFTAPAGATLTLTATPPAVNANGLSTITVVGVRGGGSGAPLPDDTNITFQTTLGSISPNPAKTLNGIATATFRAGSVSGTASISATSGENVTEAIELIIGEARPVNIVLSGSPSNLPTGGGIVVLRARVTDGDGNPVQGVVVIFQSTTGILRSGSRGVRTDSNGVAGDVLEASIDATVTAVTSNGVAATELAIEVGGDGPETCDFVFSPDEPDVDETVFFTSISDPGPGNPEIVDFVWDFGDGDRGRGQTTSHEFSESGIFNVVLTIVDDLGASTSCSEPVTVQGQEPICAFTFEPGSPLNNQLVNFNASASSDDEGIVSFEWDFGDDSAPSIESDPFTTHTYEIEGPGDEVFIIQLVVTDQDDNSSTCTLPITVRFTP